MIRKPLFQKPAELNNDPIYADQNFSNFVKEGQGNDFTEDNGNGDAGDYESTPNVPVESEFNKDLSKDNNNTPAKKVIGPVNMMDEFKKDTSKTHSKDEKAKINTDAADKSKKPAAKPGSDY